MQTNKEPRCIHRHTAKTHPNCFRTARTITITPPKAEKPKVWYEGLKIGYLDIEASSLKADFGMILSWAIKEKNGLTYYDCITRDEIFDGTFDKRVVESLINRMKSFDVLVTYFGTNFDIPFIRARALKHKLSFPAYGSILHWDVYYKVKSQLAISRKSLAVSTAFLEIDGKTPVTGEHWMHAMYGDVDALGYVVKHNIADVEILEDLHKTLEPFSKWMKKSL